MSLRSSPAPYHPSRANSTRVFLAALAALALCLPAGAAVIGISGTMSNFDVFNETGTNCYGAELEIEGVHSTDVVKTFPSHFNSMTQSDYSSGSVFGTRLLFSGYNFDPSGYIIPTVGQTTNGHYAVNLPGCEHFGFSLVQQPTTTRFYWLNQAGGRVNTAPLSVPGPTWTFVPPAGGQPAIVQAVVQPPPPERPEPQLPDSIWMKVYVTEMEREVDLEELMSGPGSIVPQEAAEVETEWALLEGGVPDQADFKPSDNAFAVIRRYEYYKYTGPYNLEDHAPMSAGLTAAGEPQPGELGQFIGSNMVAVNLINDAPEPSAIALVTAALTATLVSRRRSRGV